MNSTRRKLAIATWSAPREGNIYGKLTVDAVEATRFCEHLRATTGEKVSITHLVGKAVATALRAAPGLNGRILFDRYIPHDTVDVTFLVALEDGADLAKAKVDNADRLGVDGIAASLRQRAERLRGGKDPDFEKNKGTLRALPVLLIRPLVWLIGWLASALGASIPALGVERFPFGSCIITSVGMFGLDEGYAPPTPFARVPLLILVGAVRPAPTIVDGAVEVRDQLTITATVDHRFVDGMELGRLAKIVRAVLEDPWGQLGVARP
ncbi:MAG TPA: 2-oxo acid dehydrogenase subunit E2 [Myxococcota bacterium]|nr:2-oxo acid dehydrogenase subunit E2 [Myxococcota bacterium]